MYSRYIILLLGVFLFSIFPDQSYSQSGEYFIIDQIHLEGNRRTNRLVIFNELDVLPGDTVYWSSINDVFKRNKERLYSTALFTDVKINIKNWSTEDKYADLLIEMQENWYIYPSLIFELADRNFSVWWVDQMRDFSRVNYGVGLDHINLTGNKDKLNFKFQRGYTHKYELKYNYPYISKRWGLYGEVFFSNQKEVNYLTSENKTIFYKAEDERKLLNRFRTAFGVNFRQDVKTFHQARLTYFHNTTDPLVIEELNNDFFQASSTKLNYLSLSYDFNYDNRIFTFYPLGGYQWFLNLTKDGFGIGNYNNLSIAGGFEWHHSFSDKWIYGTRIKGKTSILRENIPYYVNRALGYGNDVVRGYELYVVDGTDYGLIKNSLRYNLLDKDYQLGEYMLLEELKKLNIRVYGRLNFDLGIVNEVNYEVNNELSNRLLYGGGPALDFLFYHTYLFSIEYSINHLGEGGLFLKGNFNF